MSKQAIVIEELYNAYKQTPALSEPAFESKEELQTYWGEQWGVNNDVGKIKSVLVHRPGDELLRVNEESVYDPDANALIHPDGFWYWIGKEPIDIKKIQQQHDSLVEALRLEGAKPVYIQSKVPNHLTKLIFTRDPFVMVPGGAIISRMAPKKMRRGEEKLILECLAQNGVPVLRTIHGTGLFEGGSFAFINKNTAVVGTSVRVNEEGARQVEEVLRPMGIRLLRVPLCGWNIHIDGAFAMVDFDLAIINPAQLPFWFIRELEDMKIKTVFGHPDEFWSCNILAVSPRRVLIANGTEKTGERLKKHGVETVYLDMSEIQRGGGSIHCSTQPLIREYM